MHQGSRMLGLGTSSARLLAPRLCLIFIATLAAYSGVRWNLAEPTGPDRSNVLIALYERRFAEIRKDIEDVDFAGYITDDELHIGGPTGHQSPNEMEMIFDFYRIQYVLAPVVLCSGSGRPIVVGHFRDTDRAHQRAASEHLVIVRDYGQGVYLLRPNSLCK